MFQFPLINPATGNKAIGKVIDFPILCKTPKDFLKNKLISIFPPNLIQRRTVA